RLLPVKGCRRGAATRIHYSLELHNAGLSQPQKLLGVRQPKPTRRLERLGHLRDLPGGTDDDPVGDQAPEQETAKAVSRAYPLRECVRCRRACGLRGKMRAEMRGAGSNPARAAAPKADETFGRRACTHKRADVRFWAKRKSSSRSEHYRF